MGLFLAGLAGPDYRRKTARAAIDLAAAARELPVGVAATPVWRLSAMSVRERCWTSPP